MKVLFVSDVVPIGGTTTFLDNVSFAFKAQKHELHLVAFTEEEYRGEPKGEFESVTIIDLKRTGSLKPQFIIDRTRKLYTFLKLFLNHHDVDIILVDLIFPAFSLAILKTLFQKQLRNTKIVYQLHGLDSLETSYGDSSRGVKGRLNTVKKRIRLYLDTHVLNTLPDKIIVFSLYSKRLLSENAVTTTSVQIKPGIEPLLQNSVKFMTQKKAREILGLAEQKKIVLIVSRLEPRKGVIHFFQEVVANKPLPNVTFLVASDFGNDGGTFPFFRTLAENPTSATVLSLGKPSRKQLALLYRAADLTVVPSLDLETFGLVSLESMSLGTPVVAYNIGANHELIPPEFLVQSNKPNRLYKKIMFQLSMNAREKNAVKNKLLLHTKTYSWNKYVKELVASVT